VLVLVLESMICGGVAAESAREVRIPRRMPETGERFPIEHEDEHDLVAAAPSLHHSDCRVVTDLSDRLARGLMRWFFVFGRFRIWLVDQWLGDRNTRSRR
jgi:hypothetical protein